MKYYVKNNNSKNTFLLFHGTGGTYRDLISIANFIDPDANIIAFEGNELEGGARRFFKRHAIGQFDIPNLILNTNELNSDIMNIKNDPNFKDTNLIGMGFSNGSNILESLMQMHNDSLKNYILLNPVYVRKELDFPNLKDINVLMVSSFNDPYTTDSDTLNLVQTLKKSGANLETYIHEEGHRLTQEGLNRTKQWYINNF